MWRELPLERLATISSGGTPSREIGEYWGGDIPWVTPTDITACRANYLTETADRITEKGLLNSPTKLLPPGTILFTSRATVGVSRISWMPVCTNQGFKNLTPLQHADGKFLFYQVQRLRSSFERYAAGSTFPEINKKDTARVLIPHPIDKGTQQKIASILTVIDAAIESTEALIAKYQQIKSGLMHDLFTRGVLPNGQLRPPHSEAPELYQKTAIGWIPKEWKVNTLRQCLKRNPTNGIYKSAEEIGEGTLMVGQTAFTADRSIDFGLCRRGFVSQREINCYGLSVDDILVTRVFATMQGVGLPTLVPSLVEPAVFESNMMRLEVDQATILSMIFFEWLRSLTARRLMMAGANASNQCSVNQRVLNPLPVPCPSLSEQRRFFARIQEMDSRLAGEQATLSKLHAQKFGLMQDLLTGKVPVKVETESPPSEPAI